MSIKRLHEENHEVFTMVLHPKRSYVANLIEGENTYDVTGSVKVFNKPSSREKDLDGASSFVDTKHDQETIASTLRAISQKRISGATNISSPMEEYLSWVNEIPSSAKNTVDLEVLRHAPTTTHTINTEKKLMVVDRLMPYYRAHRPSNHWAYPNYHTLNFFTSDSVPSNAAWLYANVASQKHPNGCYSPSGSFTIEMKLNTRYTTSQASEHYTAGTILHLSSSYALSVVSGSSRNADGKPDKFRLLLQLSSSADVRPSEAVPGVGQSVFSFLSDDNSLNLGSWHHVLVTWGTNVTESGTGSFYIDGERRGTFVFPYSTVLPLTAPSDPDVLCVGNFYVGSNSGASSLIRFFSADTALREGLPELDATPAVNYPDTFGFTNQLNAEIHDLSIREEYVPYSKATLIGGTVPHRAAVDLSNYMFYLPPMFVPGSPVLKVVDGDGGVLSSPFASDDGASYHPFNVKMSFGVAGRYNSLENFTRDFATGRHARLLNLTASVIQTTTNEAITANDYLYATSSVRLRNLNVLPCDDGNFRPYFEAASNLDNLGTTFLDDINTPEPCLISLRNMVSGSIYASLFDPTGSLANAAFGVTPEMPTEVPSGLLAVYQRTQDSTSNEVVFFDVSSLFYGERIKPGSVVIRDENMTGSNGKVSVTLRDDGYGALYRADCHSEVATWNHVGNVFYEEGLLAVKSPALPFFGKNGYELEFEGEKTVHVSKYNVLLDALSYNTSSNPSWSSSMSASFDPNREPENQKYVVISNLNFHDEDLNVVMRAQLTQPIVKRKNDRFLIKIKMDW